MAYKVDIIIAHYGIKHLTTYCLACLKSIRDNSEDYRIIFIDNASEEFELVRAELELHPHILIRNTTNLGFIKAVNQGLALSTAEYVVLLNNDTEVVNHWLPKLLEPLKNGAADMSGPRSSTEDSWQGRTPVGTGWKILPKLAMLAFFCTMFKKEVFAKCGFLDEDFGVGFGDDDWYCHKAVHAGFKLALVTDLTIFHHHRSTFFELYGKDKAHEMQLKALDLLRRKQLVMSGQVS